MGLFQVRVEVFSIRGVHNAQALHFLVDTGATLSVMPQAVADRLGVRAEEKRIFQLADGSRVARDVGHVGFAYEGRKVILPVVIGERGDVPLLGALTLEALGYEADPVHKTLRPTQMYLLHTRARTAAATVPA